MVTKGIAEKVAREVVKKVGGNLGKEAKLRDATVRGQPKDQPNQIEKSQKKWRTG